MGRYFTSSAGVSLCTDRSLTVLWNQQTFYFQHSKWVELEAWFLHNISTWKDYSDTRVTKATFKLFGVNCSFSVNRWNSCTYSPPTLFWKLLLSWVEPAFLLCCVAVGAPCAQTTSVHKNETKQNKQTNKKRNVIWPVDDQKVQFWVTSVSLLAVNFIR